MAWWDNVQGGASGSGPSGGAGGSYDPFANVRGGAGGNSTYEGGVGGTNDPFALVTGGVGSYGILDTLLNPRNPFAGVSGGVDGPPPARKTNTAVYLLVGLAVVLVVVLLVKRK